MHLKILISFTFSALVFPFLGQAQIKPGPSQTVCVIDDSESAQALATDPAWKNPEVQGLLIQRSWASLEPSEGAFDFRVIDQAIDLARQNGKFIGLALGAGGKSPDWIYPAGAHSLDLSQDGVASQRMPAPWDPVFFSAWGTLVEALGDRYDANPTVAYVAISGLGGDYDSVLARTGDDAAKFEAMGGNLLWAHAANHIVELFTASFPHTQMMLPLGPVIPGEMGRKLMDFVVDEQLASHPGQVGFSSAPLTSPDVSQIPASILSTPDLQAPLDLQFASPTVTRQVLLTTQQTLVQRASFVQVSPKMLASSGVRTAVQVANQRLAANSVSRSVATTSKTRTSGGPVTSINSSSSTTTTITTTTSSPSTTAPVSNAAKAAAAASEAVYCASLTAAAKLAAQKGQEMWLSADPSDTVGTGTQSDPFHVSTADRMNAAMSDLAESQVPNLIFHLLPGTFLTWGKSPQWCLSSGWQFLGSGEAQTIVKIDPTGLSYTGSNCFADDRAVICSNGTGHITLKDMTLDGNCIGMGSALAASFVMPAPRATVTVNVQDSTPFTVGKWLYVQDTVQTKGKNLYYGLMEVVAIPSATQLTLRNCEVATAGTVTGSLTAGSPVITGVSSLSNLDQLQALSGAGIPAGATIVSAVNGQVTISANATATKSHATLTYGTMCVPGQNCYYCPPGNVSTGTTIPATARLLIQMNVMGVVMGRTGDMAENILVKNVAHPFYEGAVGICLNGFNNCKGSLVQDCTVQDIWGTAGWIISLTSTNGADIEGNTIIGNGYNQAYSLVVNNANATFNNNSSVACGVGFFSDTGTKTNFTVSGNYFEGSYGIALVGASFVQSNFSQNSILITQSGGLGMEFVLTMNNCTFDRNSIRVQSGVVNTTGITLNSLCAGSSGNLFSNNIIDSAAVNSSYSPSYGRQSGNVNQNGNPVDLGLAH